MDTKNIINQGERAKYFIRSDKLNFNFEENDYHLEILYGMTGRKITIPKSDFLYINNKWLFSFPTQGIVGPIKARMVCARKWMSSTSASWLLRLARSSFVVRLAA